VASDDLLAANSLLGASSSAGQVAGPVAASVVLALAGFRAAFVLDAITYLIGAVVVLPLPTLAAQGSDRPGWLRETTAGIVLVTRHGALRLVVLTSAAVTFIQGRFLSSSPCMPGMFLAGRRRSSPCSKRRLVPGRSRLAWPFPASGTASEA
jgi:MFS family permease